MTELNSFQSVGSIPVWALPNAPDMTRWQWQPPKPPSFWPQLPQAEDTADIDAETEPLLAEPEVENQSLVSPEPVAILRLEKSTVVKEEIVLQTMAESSPALGLKLQALFNDEFPTVLDFTYRFKAFAKSLNKEISNGRLRGPQIFETYDLARRALALKTHDPRIHRSLFVLATRLAGTHVQKWTRLRYNWLQIMARLPNIRQSRFKNLLELFPKRGHAALSQVELGDLLLLHWESIGMLGRNPWNTRRLWRKLRGADDSTAMAALACAVYHTHGPEKSTALLWSFWDFMQLRVGGKTIVKQMLSLSKTQVPSAGFLQRLAWTSRKYDIALMLHDIVVKQTGRNNAWGPAFWEKYVAQHRKRSKYSLINPAVLAEKLLGSTPPNKAACQEAGDEPHDMGEKAALEHRQRTRITKSIETIARNHHLTERERFRHTAAFTKYLANVQGFLTAKDLSSLTDVVTEVLKRGEGGSTQRLRWYLGIVLENLGEEACTQVGMILKRRREWNGRQRADGVAPEGKVVEQTTESALRRQHYEGPHQGRTWPLWRYHLPKNRKKAKMLRRRKKAGVHIHGERPSETTTGQLNNETGDADAFGALYEEAHRQVVDSRTSF
ncbi:hypothetical protein diail_3068 [Diaporthe ilicicola]|nr:hypothetical protein diail_3068 [Diaporthe ilicicola]